MENMATNIDSLLLMDCSNNFLETILLLCFLWLSQEELALISRYFGHFWFIFTRYNCLLLTKCSNNFLVTILLFDFSMLKSRRIGLDFSIFWSFLAHVYMLQLFLEYLNNFLETILL